MQPLCDQGVRQGKHQRDIGAGKDRMPDRLDRRWKIIAQRADQVEFSAAPARRDQVVVGDMLARAAAADIVVLHRHAAKGEDQRACLRQLGPANVVAGDRRLRGDDVRQDHRRRAGTVRVDRADIAAGEVQKAVELVLRVVEAPGAGPAIGPAEHRARPMRGIDPAQFGGDAVERLGPGDRDKFVRASPPVRPRTTLQPATPHHRPGDARLVRHRSRDVAEERRRRGVARMRHDLDVSVAHPHRKRPPMRAVRQTAGRERRVIYVIHVLDSAASTSCVLRDAPSGRSSG